MAKMKKVNKAPNPFAPKTGSVKRGTGKTEPAKQPARIKRKAK